MLRMRMHIRRRNYPLIGPLCCRFAGKAASDGQMVAALGFDPMQGSGMSAPEFRLQIARTFASSLEGPAIPLNPKTFPSCLPAVSAACKP